MGEKFGFECVGFLVGCGFVVPLLEVSTWGWVLCVLYCKLRWMCGLGLLPFAWIFVGGVWALFGLWAINLLFMWLVGTLVYVVVGIGRLVRQGML